MIVGATSLHDFPGSIVRFSSPGNSRQGLSEYTSGAVYVDKNSISEDGF